MLTITTPLGAELRRAGARLIIPELLRYVGEGRKLLLLLLEAFEERNEDGREEELDDEEDERQLPQLDPPKLPPVRWPLAMLENRTRIQTTMKPTNRWNVIIVWPLLFGCCKSYQKEKPMIQ